MSSPILIHIWPRESECVICGAESSISPHERSYGLPMYCGEVLPADYEGEWAGFDCCKDCYDAYETGGPAAVEARRVVS